MRVQTRFSPRSASQLAVHCVFARWHVPMLACEQKGASSSSHKGLLVTRVGSSEIMKNKSKCGKCRTLGKDYLAGRIAPSACKHDGVD